MLKVKVLAVGTLKETWLQEAVSEYEKRLSAACSLAWIDLKDDARLAEALRQEPFYVALHPRGELLDSPSCSRKLMKLFEQGGSRLSFAIGGPEGLSPAILSGACWTWSLSPLTFTHQIARLILAEQLYRSLQIAKGSPYHK